MAFVAIATTIAEVAGPELIGGFLGDAIGGTILDGAVGGGLAEFGGGAFADAAGGGLADYGSANAFADYAAGGAGGDALGGAAASEAGSANAYADYAATGAGGAGGSGPLSSLAGKMVSPLLGNLASSVIGANGAQQSAQTQANAATQAINLQTGMFNSSQANLQPYINGGARAMGQLSGKLADGSLGGTFSGADYLANKDPGYQFQLDQGNQALQNSQAAKDGVLGGSSLKGLIDYNQGMASTGYQSAYNRWLSTQQNTYGQLAGTANIGNTAASYGANSAAKFADAIGGNITGRGNSLAAGQAGAAKNYSQAASGFGNQLYSLSDMSKSPNSSQSAFDTGFNGQNNPANQQALDDKIGSF